jgi:thioredoxin-related protein
MKLRFLYLSAAALLLASCGRGKTATEKPSGKGPMWLTNFEDAKAQAHTGHKMLLMNFTGSDWCPPCILLHRQILSQPEFADYAAKNLVLMEVDFPRTKEQSAELKAANEKLAEQYGIYGFPTEIVLDSNGKKMGELGYMPGGPQAFITALEKLRAAP